MHGDPRMLSEISFHDPVTYRIITDDVPFMPQIKIFGQKVSEVPNLIYFTNFLAKYLNLWQIDILQSPFFLLP